ncbi:hypothetical protein B9T62_23475 [Paenibacillus donghaensis]|uniref:Uncharacterized protein n=1 Tax=Paenibacillus donghaensis TaxID=414771 RepID=A0A2Z2KJN1_9BACL|nr:hypothetical protein B9T62_23475 [Paenibacillus donghaensis]
MTAFFGCFPIFLVQSPITWKETDINEIIHADLFSVVKSNELATGRILLMWKKRIGEDNIISVALNR